MDIPGLLRRVGPGKPLGLLVALVVIIFALIGADFAVTGGDPVSARAPKVLFHVAEGEPLDAVAGRLQALGVIRSSVYFRLYADWMREATDVQAGTYLVSGRKSAAEILRAFVTGAVATHRLTVPEGFTVSDIAMRLAAQGIVSEKAFVAVAKDFANPFLPKSAPVRYRLEGYAFPSTYQVPYGASATQVADIMFAQWEREFTPAMRSQAQAEGLSVNQVLTIASLVEKEASIARERPIIAAVFLNRLHRHMKIQSDPTVAYALGRHLNVVSLAQLKYPSPYNTYYVQGLPPGPICNPGLPSIMAALHPAKVGYLYFYGLPNGTHIFSYTYPQQLAAEHGHP